MIIFVITVISLAALIGYKHDQAYLYTKKNNYYLFHLQVLYIFIVYKYN